MQRLITLLLVGCAASDQAYYHEQDAGTGQAQQALGSQPLSFGIWHSGDMSRTGDKLEMLDCALMRWRAATGLPLDMSLESAHRLKWSAPDATYAGLTWGSYDSANIAINPTLADAALCQVTVHEIGHILRRNYGHPCPADSMSNPTTSTSRSKITQCDLDAVCSVRNCAWEIPE
jgi:hypothetical protein